MLRNEIKLFHLVEKPAISSACLLLNFIITMAAVSYKKRVISILNKPWLHDIITSPFI
jgi:hypothetical protein